MKKRIAKKIYRRVFKLSRENFADYVYYHLYLCWVETEKPKTVPYSKEQYAKACKVLHLHYPMIKLDLMPVKRYNKRVYLKEIAYYPNSNEVETIIAKVDYEKENHHNPITCVPGNTQPPR